MLYVTSRVVHSHTPVMYVAYSPTSFHKTYKLSHQFTQNV